MVEKFEICIFACENGLCKMLVIGTLGGGRFLDFFGWEGGIRCEGGYLFSRKTQDREIN